MVFVADNGGGYLLLVSFRVPCLRHCLRTASARRVSMTRMPRVEPCPCLTLASRTKTGFGMLSALKTAVHLKMRAFSVGHSILLETRVLSKTAGGRVED